jgi:kynurenine formamidase
MNSVVWLVLAVIALIVAISLMLQARQSAIAALPKWKIVDLTHPLTPTIPIWSGDPAIEIKPWAAYTKEGYLINRITIGEHSGTHWGTPNSFIPGAKSAEQFTAAELLLPSVVIDIRQQASQNPDYQLSLADIQAWEAAHGKIPARSLVILFTGWQDRWADPARFFNTDAGGNDHFPGFNAEAVQFLVAERQIAGLGTDTHGADPSSDDSYGASTAIYQANGMILECLAGLDQLPAKGATVIVGGLPIQGGSGSPARVMALISSR